jgi:MoaA/NifB/PqqE/SkfB family radical SAM enzyme
MFSYLGVRFQIRYHKCNLECPYCIASWKEQDNLFNLVTFKSIIEKIKQFPHRIRLRIGVGGELFTSPALMESVKDICNSESNIFNVSFSTNLVASWDRVIQPFIHSIDTGKLGMGCTLHDTVIKDVNGFFEKAKNIKEMGVEVYIGYVAIPGRFSYIAEYKKRCEDLGIPLIMNGLVGHLSGVENSKSSLVYPRDYTLDELAELKELWDTPHSYKLLLESCETKGMLCSSGRNYIYIDHLGNVFPCKGVSNQKGMGNILSDRILFQKEDTICPESVCWCGNENQALRIVDQYYDRSGPLRILRPKEGIPHHQLYEGYNAPVYNRLSSSDTPRIVTGHTGRRWKNSGPIVVGGIGGSGTRVVAAILRDIGYYMGSDLNDSLDNLWFTLLFKRPRWFCTQRDLPSEIFRGLSIFKKIMKGDASISFSDYAFVISALVEIMAHGHDHLGSGRGVWPLKHVRTMFQQRKKTGFEYIGWGWKEPNSHIFLEYLNVYFPDLKYVHTIRHGLDMAFSRNQAQLYNWGKLLGVEKPKDSESIPAASLEFWIRANQKAISFGKHTLGNRFYLLNFDQLLRNPTEEVTAFLKFLHYEYMDSNVISRLCQILRGVDSMGRYQRENLALFRQESLNEVTNLGFKIIR